MFTFEQKYTSTCLMLWTNFSYFSRCGALSKMSTQDSILSSSKSTND